jgi:RHS repeat-associated protein
MGSPTCGEHCVGDPINTLNGNKFETTRVIAGAASGLLNLELTYNSLQDSAYVGEPAGVFGKNRSFSFGSAIVAPPVWLGKVVYVTRPDGKALKFSSVQGVWVADPGREERLNRTDEAWELTLSDGAIERYRADGRLAGKLDGAGRSVLLAYSPSGLLESVVDDQGRRLAFTYNQAKLVEKVVTSEGDETKFEYTGGLLSAVVHADGSQLGYKYKEAGYANQNAGAGVLTGVIDELGSRSSSTWYDAKGKAYKTDLANGVSAFEVSYTRENEKLVSTTTLPSGASRRAVARVSDGALESSSFVDTCDGCLPRSSAYAFSQGFLSSKTVAGVVTEFERQLVDSAPDEGASGDVWIERTTEASNRPEATTTEVWRRRDTNQIVKRVSPARTQTWLHNARGQVIQESTVIPSGESRTTTYSYCDQVNVQAGCPVVGLLLSVDGPMPGPDDTVSYTYYPEDAPACATSAAGCSYRRGDLWKTIQPLGNVTEVLSYDGDGRPHMTMDPNGVVTEYRYTPRGWVESVTVLGSDDGTAANDRITTMEYLPTGPVSRITAPDGNVVTYTYDAAQRLTDVGDGAGNSIHYTLDASGNRMQEEYKGAGGEVKRTLSRVYNGLSQLVTSADGFANPTDYGYDSEGNQVSITSPLGRVTRHEYDPFSRLKRTVQDVGGIAAETGYQYDPESNLVQVTDPKGLATTYAYNGFGDAVGQQSPDTGSESYTLDAVGNRKTRTDARGVTATYQYDVLNRLTAISYPDPTLDVAYTYDVAPAVCATDERFARGRVGHVVHAAGSTDYCYDRLGQVTRKVQTVNGVSTTVRYAYNKAGSLAGLTYPDGSVADYVHDSLGRTTEVGLTRPGQARQVVVTNVTYAPFGPITGWTYGNGRRLERPVDADYRPLKVYDAAPGGLSLTFGYDPEGNIVEIKDGLGASSLAKYEYDALGRLTQTQDGPTGTPIETYAYDATGNRTALTTGNGTSIYTYPPDSHRLIDVDGVSREYDEAGNTENWSQLQFSYNDAGRMSTATQPGDVSEDYRYDDRGARVYRTRLSGAVEVSLFDASGQWIGRYDGDGRFDQQALWLGGFPIAVMSANALGQAELAYVQPDHLGTPRAVIDAAGDLTLWEWSNKGEAFGSQLPNSDADGDGEAFGFDLRFPGQQDDRGLSSYYNYGRNYDPSTGRYLQSDPSGLDGGISTFSYAESNPLSAFDPDGLQARYLPRQPSPGYGGWNGYGDDFSTGSGSLGGGGGGAAGGDALELARQLTSPGAWADPNGVNQMFARGLISKALSSGKSIRVPYPDRKNGMYSCICRANRDGRSPDNCSIDDQQQALGYGVGYSARDAKRAAERDAKQKLGAKATHHIQCRCRDPKGDEVIPHG